jgi:hypothetical protein
MTRNPRLGRRRVRHLIDGGAPRAGEQRLAEVLGTLADHRAAPPRPVPPELLAAFTRQAEEPASRRAVDGRARTGARSRGVHRALTVKTAAVVLVLSGGTMAVAAADDLPAPAQRAAHAILGSWGVPAPSAKHRPNKRQLRVNTRGSTSSGTHPAGSAGPLVPPSVRQSPDTPGARPSAAGSCRTLAFGDAPGGVHDCAPKAFVPTTASAAPVPAATPSPTGTPTATPSLTPTPGVTDTATLGDHLVPSPVTSTTKRRVHRGRNSPSPSPSPDDAAS